MKRFLDWLSRNFGSGRDVEFVRSRIGPVYDKLMVAEEKSMALDYHVFYLQRSAKHVDTILGILEGNIHREEGGIVRFINGSEELVDQAREELQKMMRL